jgi:hypothetical protein
MNDASAVELVRSEIESLTRPLTDIVRSLDEQIAEKQREVDELKDARKQASRMLRVADPSFEAEQKPGPKPAPYIASESRVKQVQAWLEAHRDDPLMIEGFTSTWLTKHADWNGLGSQSYTSQALRVLHDRGVIRLDRTGSGGSKVFVLA